VLLSEAQELGAQIIYILSAWLPDHICDNGRIEEASDAKLCIHELDAYHLLQPLSKDPLAAHSRRVI